jgi:hypothetical protein
VPRLPDRRFAAFVVLAYLPVALFAIGHHEMWRDELHCWLVARDSATPWDVVRNRAYDGQPPLWYLLLWCLQKTAGSPLSMQIAHVAIAVAVVWVFASRAPFGRVARAAFPFGYFMAYEYVALSRCYGLALLLALLLCTQHAHRFERPGRVALLLVALALTTTVSTVVVAAYTAALLVDAAGAARRGVPSARRAWLPIAAGVAGCLTAALCTWPPADSTVTHMAWPRQLPSDDAPTRLLVALAPIPRVDFFFWNSNALLAWEPLRRVAFPLAVVLAAWIAFLFSRVRAAALLFATGALLLVALFAFVYGGDVRHHGFFYVLFIMGAWLARTPEPRSAWRGGGSDGNATAARWRRLRAAGLAPTLGAVLALQMLGTPVALYYDGKYVFSSGGRAASALEKADLAGSLLVAEIDFPATAVIGHLKGDARAYSPRTGRTFSFVKWTRDRHWDPTDEQTVRFAEDLGATQGRDPVLIMNRPLLPELVDGAAVQRIAELYDSMIEEENFYIYRVARRR